MNNVHIGDRIKIIHMDGEPQYTNRESVVTHIDDAGIDTQAIHEGVAAIREEFFSIPLKNMKKEVVSYSEAVSRAAKLIDDLIL